MAIKSM